MKVVRLFTILFMVLICANSAMAQSIEPTRISWKVGMQDVSIAEGQDQGIKLTDCYEKNSALSASTRSIDAPRHFFSMECLFDADELEASFPDGTEVVVKWYYYMSTKRMLMFTSKKMLDALDAQISGENKGFVVLKSHPRLALRAGWWEVTITNIATKEDLSFGGSKVFKVRID